MNKQQFRQYIETFDFTSLFNQLGWAFLKESTPVKANDETYTLQSVAQKSGFRIIVCQPNKIGNIPEHSVRLKIDNQVSRLFKEHLLIFIDKNQSQQLWQTVHKEINKPAILTAVNWSKGQDPEFLYQKAAGLIFTLEEEDVITIVDVVDRVSENFYQNNEKVTKQFYDRFKKEHTSFLSFIKGINGKADKEWYASLMLNRLMFCYFIQKKGFLDQNKNYLRDKLRLCKEKKGKDKFYSFYRSFLLVLFHEGLNEPAQKEKIKIEIGKIPYLNGGLFDEHQLEKSYNIDIDDAAFERLFDFFDQYEWHLDTRITATGRDINPDVIGYIFEKYINDRADMGAYYTKEDITDYISKNCIIPWLFDETSRHYTKPFTANGEIWKVFKESGDKYIYDAVKFGLAEPLPQNIAAGVNDVAKRSEWNKQAPADIGLPTEIWREVVERRKRYEELKTKIGEGKVNAIIDFITLNLNIRQFTQDIIENSNDPEFIMAVYKALNRITIIDPACGSGAFLFAAMNILEPLYYACIMRMRAFVDDEDRENDLKKKTFSNKYKYFRGVLEEVQSEQHPNLQYFIYKSIILNNIYGVDIMREAVEIAKLRLFLKLVATVEADYKKKNLGLEPLPDIDFNVRAGNTLIGFATFTELEKLMNEDLEAAMMKDIVIEKCDKVRMAYKIFKDNQLSDHDDYKSFKEGKNDLEKELRNLNNELNELLHKHSDGLKYDKWITNYQPFHWFAEFYEIIHSKNGFDVIIGNPPYVQNNKISYGLKNYTTEECGNLYATIIERCGSLSNKSGYKGFIVPVSSISTEGYGALQKILAKNNLYYSSFDDRPSKLFDGLEHIRLTIHLILPKATNDSFSSKYNKWNNVERGFLFQTIKYVTSEIRVLPNSLPKLSSELEISILNKMKKQKNCLLLHQEKNGKHAIYFSRKVGYFLQILNFEPMVLDSKKQRRPPSEFKEIGFKSKLLSDSALCLLNSNLFYWFITVFSDCRHLNKREIDLIPINLDEFSKSNSDLITQYAKDIMKDIQKNSENKLMKFKHDTLTIQCFYVKYSKNIIDNIDKILGEYYGFSNDELDFIINYDIKYRMGKELESESEE